ncbi:MAG TPA: DNA internalization-related competence protein ComEC/Rec2, partial [Marinobacter sp.]|nr:DNA internalization-related competence protein ComEC/Rec2 [Marinobacter sp.]
WQLRQGIGAGGYIRKHPGNRELTAHSSTSVRARIRHWVRSFERRNQDLLQALLLGDRSEISAERWQLLRDTGTSHLIAISGLHIGLVAGFAYLLGTCLGRVLALISPIRAVVSGAVLAIIAAIIYSALAGFSLPTQRALIMLLMVMLARLTGRRFGPAQILSAALAAVLVYDPLALYDVGFWLSFGAVATLVLVFSGRLAALPGSRLVALWRPQWVIFIGLAVPLIIAFGQVSLISPVANMIAIPVVSLLVVPLLLLAAVLGIVSDFLAEWLLMTVDAVLSGLFTVLAQLADLPRINWLRSMSLWAVPLAALAVVGLLVPGALRLRVFSLALLVLAIGLPPAPQPALAVTVLDVGQALAVVVRAEDKTLVYDTGLRFSANFDTGRDIIADHLRRRGVERVDALVLSHDNADHTGGAVGLMQALAVDRVYLGEPLRRPQHRHIRGHSCHQGQHWQWGEARFSFVTHTGSTLRGNNASCVLLIEFRGQTLVLSGDIEASREPRIVAAIDEEKRPVFLLLAPHHGSRSSSTTTFVRALQPKHTVISSGYRNRHGHPHVEVVARYRAIDSRVYNTAVDGAVQFIWHRDEAPQVFAQRRHARRFWYEPWQMTE